METTVKKPLISEKSFQLVGKNQYTFIGSQSLTCNQAKKQIESIFNVTVLGVNSANISGKRKMARGHLGKRKDFKKFIITLKDGQKIDLFDIEENERDKKQKSQEKKGFLPNLIKGSRARSQVDRGRQDNDPTALSMQGGS